MKKQSNILFILSDDQGAWAMRCAGNRDVQTPYMDSLAETGVRFTNFYCASPVCSPARASILTGYMPSAHGVLDWISGGNVNTDRYPQMAQHPGFATADQPIDFISNTPSWLTQLSRNGYRTGLSGKWHLGHSDQPHDGMEKWFVLRGGGCDYYMGDCFEDGSFYSAEGYITDIITQKATAMLDEFSQTSDHPFCLSVHYTAPHAPWDSDNHPQEYLSLYDDCEFSATPVMPVHPCQTHCSPIGDSPEMRRECLRGFYAAITAMDAGIGRLIETLRHNNQLENTIIIFTSDNGMNMGHHGIWGKGNGTYPPNMYDSSVKVPFIISGPGIAGNKCCHQLASHCDIFPTIMELTGTDFCCDRLQSGRSLVPMLMGGDIATQATSIGICDEYGAVRMIRNERYKLIRNYCNGTSNLFDLELDPDETTDRIEDSDYQAIAQSMATSMEAYFAKYSLPQCDGRRFAVKGRGQRNFAEEKDAFAQDVTFYYQSAEK